MNIEDFQVCLSKHCIYHTYSVVRKDLWKFQIMLLLSLAGLQFRWESEKWAGANLGSEKEGIFLLIRVLLSALN